LADPPNDPLDLFDRACGAVDIGAPQLGGKQMPAAENVERQVAVVVVIAVEDLAFLVTMQRIVGRIEIQNDLPRRFAAMRLDEQIHEPHLDGRRIVTDLVIAGQLRAAQLQSVQGALARHGRAIGAASGQLARQDCHHRIVA
jgi:hypothetical protein